MKPVFTVPVRHQLSTFQCIAKATPMTFGRNPRGCAQCTQCISLPVMVSGQVGAGADQPGGGIFDFSLDRSAGEKGSKISAPLHD